MCIGVFSYVFRGGRPGPETPGKNQKEGGKRPEKPGESGGLERLGRPSTTRDDKGGGPNVDGLPDHFVVSISTISPSEVVSSPEPSSSTTSTLVLPTIGVMRQ